MECLRAGCFWRDLDGTGRVWAIALAGMAFQQSRLPGVGVAVAEVAALPLLALGAWAAVRHSGRRAATDAGVFAWTAGALAAVFVFSVRFGWGPAAGMGHEALAALYVAVRTTATPASLAAFPELLKVTALVAGVLGLVGWGLAWAGIATPLALSNRLYPYLGALPRAQGLTISPNMLASLLGTAILVSGAHARLLLLAFAACLPKTVLALGAGALVGSASSRRERRTMYLIWGGRAGPGLRNRLARGGCVA